MTDASPPVTRPLRVGLNLVYFERASGGSGTYARELIRAILAVEPETQLTAFVSRSLPDDVLDEPWAPRVRWVRFGVDATGNPWHFLPELAGIAIAAARRRLDVVHGLAYIAPPVAPRVATVVTILDTIWMQLPETVDWRFRTVMRGLVPAAARGAERVVAISEAAREDLVAHLGIPRDKIDVTLLGIRPEQRAKPTPEHELRQRLGLDGRPVVLCVAAKRAHKNLAGLVRAVAAMGDGGPQLVLPGAPTDHETELRALAEQLQAAERVRFCGWLEESELEGLYALASCFVLPSFTEGFGLPVLEAMSRGVPVVCSDRASLPEVAGDAAILFDPDDVDSLVSGLERVLGDERLAADLVARGRERVGAFTWERTARATLDVYRRALAQRSG